MKNGSKWFLLVGVAVLVATSPAAADDDVAACEGKSEGDACEEADGEKGTCLPDDGTDVLECESPDGAGGSGADDDTLACEGKSEGDACEEADGEKGTCRPDDDSDALECEDGDDDDDATGRSSDALGSAGCSAAGAPAGSSVLAIVALVGAAVRRRTRR